MEALTEDIEKKLESRDSETARNAVVDALKNFKLESHRVEFVIKSLTDYIKSVETPKSIKETCIIIIRNLFLHFNIEKEMKGMIFKLFLFDLLFMDTKFILLSCDCINKILDKDMDNLRIMIYLNCHIPLLDSLKKQENLKAIIAILSILYRINKSILGKVHVMTKIKNLDFIMKLLKINETEEAAIKFMLTLVEDPNGRKLMAETEDFKEYLSQSSDNKTLRSYKRIIQYMLEQYPANLEKV